MNLFYVLKLNISYILQHNSQLKLTYEKAIDDNLIVALGDNQLFNFIRRLTNKEDIITDIQETRKLLSVLKKQEKTKENVQQYNNLNSRFKLLTFCPEIISIKADTTKKDYKNICKDKFTVEFTVSGVTYNKRYKRLCAGAGQLRRNSAIFVDESIYNELETIMLCGLTKNRIGKMNLAKFSAYYALYTSASRKVTTPHICVIDDYEYTLHDQDVYWIFDNEDGEKDVDERKIDFEINAFDGSGIVCPKMAQQWAEDLNLDYLPSSFIVRAPWVKGLCSVFDFHLFAKEIAKTDKIIDIWGNEHNVKDIDVILTKSQFKLKKCYNSWEEYLYYFKKFKHIFSITRVNKKEDNRLTTLNYQYIQTNNFTKETIQGLADYSINWAKKLMSKDYLTTMLYLKPSESMMEVQRDMSMNTVDDNITRALMYCPNLVNDRYINQKIIRSIQNKIDKMKIGKIWVEGAYEFIIPDLYALCEHAFKLEVKGLLPADTVWNRRWVSKGSKKVTMHRSPLVAPSENRILNIYSDDRCMKWYSYIQSGNMMNIWDMTAIAASDAD